MFWRGVLILVLGVAAAVLFSLALAYVLKHQRLHWQIEALRRLARRSRSPWAEEDAAWAQLGQAVDEIPEDLRPREKRAAPTHDRE